MIRFQALGASECSDITRSTRPSPYNLQMLRRAIRSNSSLAKSILVVSYMHCHTAFCKKLPFIFATMFLVVPIHCLCHPSVVSAFFSKYPMCNERPPVKRNLLLYLKTHFPELASTCSIISTIPRLAGFLDLVFDKFFDSMRCVEKSFPQRQRCCLEFDLVDFWNALSCRFGADLRSPGSIILMESCMGTRWL